MKFQRNSNSQDDLEKKTKDAHFTLSDFKICGKVIAIRTLWY